MSRAGIFLSMIVFVAGCGRGDSQLVEVTGSVTYRGAPVADANVVFQPEEGCQPVFGTTDANGLFQLSTSGRLGVAAGRASVAISAFEDADPARSSERG